MGFLLQLRLLVWKNFILRKRHWVRLCLEIAWPLLLFIILVLVRTRGLRKYNHQCFFDEKAMPSTGLATFAQSFICTFNNTCHKDAPSEFSRMDTYNDSFISTIVTDIETALERNFNQDKVDALGEIFTDLSTLQKASVKVRDSIVNGEGIQGLTVERIQNLVTDPTAFSRALLAWSSSKGITLQETNLQGILTARLRPGNVAPTELLSMLSNPRTAICDPDIVSRLIESGNMARGQVQESIRPLCNLSMDDAMELLEVVRPFIDWEQLEREAEEFSVVNGNKALSFNEWQKLIQVSEDIRRDLLEKPSVKQLIGDVSDFIKNLTEQMTMEVNSTTAANSSIFTRNISSNGRLAFAAFQRVVCGRNMSADQLFSDGGAANRFDQLRDQLKEKDEEVFYLYDNTTSKECNDVMSKLEENRLTGFLWDQMKPFIRGKILYTPDTPATRRLMRVVNETFGPIEDVRRLTKIWVDNYAERVSGLFLDKENQDFIKDAFTSDDFLDLLLTNNITKALNEEGSQELVNDTRLREQLREYFSGNFSAEWADTFNTVDNVMKNISTYLSCFDFDKFVGVPTEYDLEVDGTKLITENKLWAGIVFVDFPTNDFDSDELPEFIKYKIRLDSDKVDNTRYIEDRLPRPGPRRRPGIDLKYLYFGFSYLQDMIEHSIIAVHSGRNRTDLPGITLQQMPYPCYIEDRFIIAISRTFPLFMTLAWVYSASMIIKSIVYEKEQRLKETMRVMGLGNSVHWISWFIDSFALMSFSAFLLTIILTYGDILSKSDPTVIFCFMQTYTVSTIMLCFFLSTLFSRANVAAAAGGIIFFCFYLPYSFMVVWEESLSSDFKIVSCLISNIAFGFGCAYFSHYEESGIGAQWSNIWESPLVEDKFSMAGAMGMLLIDSVLYGLLAWYIEAVFPGQYGVPKPWYFFLTKSYWFGEITTGKGHCGSGSLSEHDASMSELELGAEERGKDIEPEPTHLPLGVSIQHLSKVYGNGKVAVEDLNLNFYEGQITSFLGHNGAGKTTTISILTGLFPPSAGTAKIGGKDIRRDMDSIRQSLGVCPQHNVLFDHLTVFEHLWFYARLKGRDPEQIRTEAETMIHDLGLPHKRDELSKNLSGGMQRKLSIASAFVGGSKTVVLDEPTAGVDPYSRRSIWDLLIKYKEGRSIILTTHFMDEADLLGDRIAIINNGALVCVGSSLFLRARFGNGYYLTLVREDENEEEGRMNNEDEKELSSSEDENEPEVPWTNYNKVKTEEDDEEGEEKDGSDAEHEQKEQDHEEDDPDGDRMKSAPPKFTSLVAETAKQDEVDAMIEEAGADISTLPPLSSLETTQDSAEIKNLYTNLDKSLGTSGARPNTTNTQILDLTAMRSEAPGASVSSAVSTPVGEESSRQRTVSAIINSSGSESVENDILIDDEGISDIAKTNGIVINPSRTSPRSSTYPMTKFIQKYVPSARLLEQIGSEVIYVLPTDDKAVVKKFENLFSDLERYRGLLRIKSYGLSDTTLEEIFLKVASNVNDGELVRNKEDLTTPAKDNSVVANRVRSASESSGLRHLFSNKKKALDNMEKDIELAYAPSYTVPPVMFPEHRDTWTADKEVPRSDSIPKEKMKPKPKVSPFQTAADYEGKGLFWKHIKALQIKRFHHSRRNKKGMLCEILLPAMFVCLAMIFTLVLPPLEEQKQLEIHPWIYPYTQEYETTTFYANQHPDGDWPRRYETELFSETGMGTKCVKDAEEMTGLGTCSTDELDRSNFFYPPDVDLDNMDTASCNCDIGTQQCPAGAEGLPPPYLQMASNDILQNLTGRNLSDYLLKTRSELYKRRYGGFEFGVRNPLANRNISMLEDVTDRWLKATNMGKPRIDDNTREVIFGNLEDLALSNSVFDNIRVWFNNKGWAASMAYMNAVNNVVLRASIKAQNDDLSLDWDEGFTVNKDATKFGFAVVNHPMNFTKDQLDTEVIRQIGISLLHAICVIFAMSFVPASFVIFNIDERVTKVRHLQFVSGVKPITYWTAAFFWDITMFCFSATLCVLIFLAFDAQAYVSEDNLPSLIIILFLYGFSSIPLMYPASFLFEIPSSAFVTLSCGNLFAGIITTVTTFVLENFEDDELQYIGSILKEVFLIFPQYCLGRGLMDMATEMNLNLIIARFGLVSVRSRFSWNFLGKYMVCMIIQGFLFFGLTLLIQYKFWEWRPKFLKFEFDVNELEDLSEEDEDVKRERDRVMTKSNPKDVLAVRALVKKYSKKSKPAVDRLTFSVRKGECFGLLGVNGAGKTTTFKMMTGDTDVTGGDAKVNGASIVTELQKVRRSLGYCPQFDALNPLLTGREHLKLYARLRGLDEDNVRRVADWGLKKLGLLPYADRCAGTYSGGNKRKLSTAIALVGNPSIVFLDEPTTGMDPGARRFLWNCILEMIRGGQSVVLTSHSMEECEALCTRLGIMVNGRFQCLGSAQHLKNRFGSGYTLTLRSNGAAEAISKLKELIAKLFPKAELKEEHYNQLQYQLSHQDTKLPVVFKEMERAKTRIAESMLEDYTITQTTLDEVFIRFASKQTELKEESDELQLGADMTAAANGTATEMA